QSVQVTCDETMVKNGFRAGPSGGGNITRITIVRPRIVMKDGKPEIENEVIPAASSRLYDPYANLWIHWFLCGCEEEIGSRRLCPLLALCWEGAFRRLIGHLLELL